LIVQKANITISRSAGCRAVAITTKDLTRGIPDPDFRSFRIPRALGVRVCWRYTWLGWLHILSDLGVWSAYLAIPLVLVYFLLRRKDLPFRKIFLLFGAFILACGTTHLMEAIIFCGPSTGCSAHQVAHCRRSWAT